MAHSKASFQPTCPSIQHCSDWARIYLKYCLCSAKDGVSIFLGIVSIISWGVAEVPQILTNFREKSIEGLSAAFLMTWVVGDLFNLIGCILEPATLPTQYYTALLYTATTLILTGQTIYYGHIYHRHRVNKNMIPSKNQNLVQDSESLLSDAEKTNVGGHKANVTSLSEDNNLKSSPIPVTRQLHPGDSNGRDFYFVSARSLSKSPMPTFGTWLAYSHENGIPYHFNDGQHDEQFAAREPLLSSQSAPTKLSTKNILSVVPSASLSICICVYHLCFHDSTESHGMVLQVGRKLLQDELRGDESSGAGTLFGWMMAAIYVGGRLPQICLNIKRGNAQGLNPLMFIFALVGNITYVGSILVKSLAWSAIKPNLPWLVDAGGCAILDAFIIIQFVYFRLRQSKKSASNNNQV
ncbi:probable vacuolar amino acid transporter YPQ1 [Zingiber officinale]|uniref:probable vacuolar amino acid transporter YPQ1 n=1 Tax=Zingiber officinale TaxID=94328 RepID=UPI001C4BADDB|nr:probable vacuolar amino acid transporter YPQ1 [Zingiber officinale]XP_042461600.1 probable vacuolar amino acid transporter YPQ1 [Zingiber officinale]